MIILISAPTVIEHREELLSLLESSTSAEAKKMKVIIRNLTEEDNPLLMVVTFK